MTISELSQKLELKIVSATPQNMEREVKGVYTCDLLSHAMAKINEGDVWITVHTNLNVVAVASLTDCACVLIPENIEIDDQTIERASEKDVMIFSSTKSAAVLCYEINRLIKDR
ncbi:MAG: AraC family transcriptional regulator [Clostridiaceae bacterium]|nr:AraC family transcriptional regulator [Clostridiaceae bacterium]